MKLSFKKVSFTLSFVEKVNFTVPPPLFYGASSATSFASFAVCPALQPVANVCSSHPAPTALPLNP
jgi:hypothetical protein